MRNKNILNKNRKILYMVLSIAILSILTLTVVYAALSTTLNITGNAEVTAASWDVYLDNVQLNSQSATTNLPTISNKTTASFTTSLTNPGDFYEFTIDVINNGTIDAMIDSITKSPKLTDTEKKYLNYIVEYQNGEAISNKQLVEKDSFVRLKVKVEFRNDISASDLPTTSETLNLSFQINYIQSDESSSIVPNNGVKLIKIINGDYDTVGSEICIDKECFYVISSDNNNVSMISKYNLYVGGEYDGTTWTEYNEEKTGLQNVNMIGQTADETYPYRGTTVFSSDEQKGDNYSSYKGSIAEQYVNNYKLYLETSRVTIQEAHLVTKNELTSLGCSTSNYSCKESEYQWIYSTSYWTGFTGNTYFIWTVSSNGELNVMNFYSNTSTYGIRPVITISKSEF